VLSRLFRDLFRPAARDRGPRADPAHAALARARQALDGGAPDEAERLCREVLDETPARVEARALLGAAQLERGDPTAAVDTLRAALRDAPDHGESQFLLAKALRAAEDLPAAVLAMERARRFLAERPDFWNESGLLQLQLGNLDSARFQFERAAALGAHQAQAWINLAVVAQRQGAYAKALACLKRAVDAEPASGLAWSNYGLALRDNERLDEAVPALRRAAELRPQHAWTRVNLATVLADDEQYADARAAADRALELAPALAEAHVVLASLHTKAGEFAAADERYRRALAVAPRNAVARAGLGELQLLQRDFAHGWDSYEARFELPDAVAQKLTVPRWDGRVLAEGRLAVRSEQGLGDMILFASCIPDVLERVRGLVLEVPPKLVGLFGRSFPGADVRPASAGYPPWLDEFKDVVAAIPAGSLMGLFRRRAADFPARERYFLADPERAKRWRERLTVLGPGPKIGIAWSGGFFRTGRKNRTIGPADLDPLLAHPGAHFVSLQYAAAAETEAAALAARRGLPVHHWPEAITDYEDTAALVSGLDMVITVCTAVAHLSGALGKPVAILAPEIPSWRYLAAGEDLPWYPTARVFRRAHGGDWAAVVERAADALRAAFPAVGQPAESVRRSEASPNPAPRAAAVAAAPGTESRPPEPTTRAPTAAGETDPLLGRVRALRSAGELDAAISALESAVADDPARVEYWHELGSLYAALNRLQETRDCLRLALHHDPRHLDSLLLLGKLCESADAIEEAMGCYATACEAAPERPGLFATLSRLRYYLGRHADAQDAARRAIALDPDCFDAYAVLGLSNIAIEDYPAAIEALEPTVRLAPGMISAHVSLATAYLHAGRFAEAKERLRWVVGREPNDFIARWDYAHLQLASREFEDGWVNYEYRKQAIARDMPTLHCPEWRGTPLDEATLVVLREQGLGDEIMFVSCMPDVLARVRHCVLQCDRRLSKLFARSFPGVRVVPFGQPLDVTGEREVYEVLGGSLPVLFRPTGREFPACAGYLRADEGRVAAWRTELARLGPGLKVGVSWRGGTAQTRAKLRSIPLRALASTLNVPGAQLVSLQYGGVEQDLADLARETGIRIANYPEAIPDYDETAALVSALDVVITVCTSIVHLGGALGRPVWVLVPSVPEWRYCLEGETLPWYPSVRLIRQRPGEPWGPAVEQVAGRLRAAVTAGRA